MGFGDYNLPSAYLGVQSGLPSTGVNNTFFTGDAQGLGSEASPLDNFGQVLGAPVLSSSSMDTSGAWQTIEGVQNAQQAAVKDLRFATQGVQDMQSFARSFLQNLGASTDEAGKAAKNIKSVDDFTKIVGFQGWIEYCKEQKVNPQHQWDLAQALKDGRIGEFELADRLHTAMTRGQAQIDFQKEVLVSKTDAATWNAYQGEKGGPNLAAGTPTSTA